MNEWVRFQGDLLGIARFTPVMNEWVRAGDKFQGDLLGIARSAPALNNHAAVSIGLQFMGKG
jgi:hypothetical protein